MSSGRKTQFVNYPRWCADMVIDTNEVIRPKEGDSSQSKSKKCIDFSFILIMVLCLQHLCLAGGFSLAVIMQRLNRPFDSTTFVCLLFLLFDLFFPKKGRMALSA